MCEAVAALRGRPRPGAGACPVRGVGADAGEPTGALSCAPGSRGRPATYAGAPARRATLAHDRGTSPARPRGPGARTRPTSGPSTHARCRSVRSAARARHPMVLMHPRSRRARARSSGGEPPVDRGATRSWPVDNRQGRARVWITPPAGLVAVPRPDRVSREMQEWTPCMTTRSRRPARPTTTS